MLLYKTVKKTHVGLSVEGGKGNPEEACRVIVSFNNMFNDKGSWRTRTVN